VALELPLAEVVACPGTPQVVLAVDEQGTAVVEDHLEEALRQGAPDRSREQVEGLVDDVILGERPERGPREEPRAQGAHAPVEPAPHAALGAVHEQEAAEGEVAPQACHLGVVGGGEVARAGEVQERVAEEVGIGEAQRGRLDAQVDAGALVDLPGQAADRGGTRVPVAAGYDELADLEPRALAEGCRAAGSEEERGAARDEAEESAA
jgi:hypothetical protein